MVDAKGIICYLGIRRLGYSGEEVARALSITRSGVSRGASRGAFRARTGKVGALGEANQQINYVPLVYLNKTAFVNDTDFERC